MERLIHKAKREYHDPHVGCVYIIRNVPAGKIYVGGTCEPHIRISQHLSELKRQKHSNKELQSDFNKYGIWSFIAEVVETIQHRHSGILRSNVRTAERKLIRKLNPHYNISLKNKIAA